MTDFLGDAFEGAAAGVGQALSPIEPALSFLGLGAEDPAGRVEEPGSLISALGRGLQDAAMAGPAGLAAGAAAAAQPNLSPRERLLLGGLLLAGGTATGRQVYANWRARAAQAAAPPPRPSQVGPMLLDSGQSEAYWLTRQEELREFFPTVGERPLQIMAQEDNLDLARSIARFDSHLGVPDERIAYIASRLEEYEAASADAFGAFDWARFDELNQKGILPREVQPIYDNFTDGVDTPDEDWAKLSDFVRKTSDADLQIGPSGRLAGIVDNGGRPMLVVRYERGAEGMTVDELPASLGAIPGESMPAAALTTEADGLTAFVDEFDVTHASEATRDADHWMRNLYPGPLGDDGIPRWLPARPLQLRSFDAIDSATLNNPGVVVETMHADSYPGFQPGDFIAFDAAADKLPPWAQAAQRLPGGVARERPERANRKLGQVDLVDGMTTGKALQENAWAVFNAPPEDLVAQLRAKGFQPVPLREGDQPAMLVFGNAEAFDPDYTHSGWRAPDPDVESDVSLPETEWVVPTNSGERVALSIPDMPYDTSTPRVTDRVERYVYKVDQSQAHQLAGLAADLENTGASNLAIYSRQPEIEGFEVARERVYGGPAATVKVVRAADPLVGESNAVPVHVRTDSGLPTRPLELDPNEVRLDAIEFEDVGGGRARVEVEAEGDLFRRLRDATELAQVFGHANVEVTFEGKRIPLFEPARLPEPGRRRAREAYEARAAEAPPPPETRFWGDVR